MIFPLYYIPDRKVNYFFEGKISHYVRKERTKVFEKTPYAVKSGDTLYSIAAEIFGKNGEYHWTIISDINSNRMPYDLQVGETIFLPKLILEETFNRLPNYEQNITTTTPISI